MRWRPARRPARASGETPALEQQELVALFFRKQLNDETVAKRSVDTREPGGQDGEPYGRLSPGEAGTASYS